MRAICSFTTCCNQQGAETWCAAASRCARNADDIVQHTDVLAVPNPASGHAGVALPCYCSRLVGQLELYSILQISAEEAQKVLKDLVFSMWTSDDCEERTDTLKMLAQVDFFLPFLPLERPHIEQLFSMRLQDRRRALMAEKLAADLTWSPAVVQFLAERVRLHPPSLSSWQDGKDICPSSDCLP